MDILERLSSIAQPINDFLVMLFSGFMTVFDMIPKGLAFLTGAIPYLPDLVAPFATVTIAVSIILMIIGRQNI